MPPPNLILILTDHFRRSALGGSTPNLMKLASEGVRFSNAYCASPLCMPSRNNIISGLPNWQTGICGNQAEPLEASLRADTFMRRLQGAGYYTALIGKHHYIDSFGEKVDVCKNDARLQEYGFDDVLQVQDDGENGHNDDAYTHYLKSKGKLEPFREALSRGGYRHPFDDPDETAEGFIGTRGVQFVRDYSGKKPFYLNLSFIGPHPPFWHPGELKHDPEAMPSPKGATDSEAQRIRRAHYMDKCSLIDNYVGKLVEALRDKGLYDNTVIILTSDHGENLGDFGIWDKRFFYEESVGVPLLMRGPGVPKDERMNGPLVSKALVSLLDLYPTLLGLAGLEMSCERRRPGLDLRAVLAGVRRREIFAELGTAVMIRTGNWKLVYDPEGGGVQQLYNLAVDPKELNNLAGVAGYEAITSQLIERILADRIRHSQYTHIKEEQRVQRVRVDY